MFEAAETEPRPADPGPARDRAKSVIRTEGLSMIFGAVRALDRLDIDIAEGEFVSIMGPSGSGKTTLLNILSCLDTPSEGVYRLDGVDVSGMSEQQRAMIRREKIGLVFQQFHLIPYLTALENVMLAQHYHSVADAGEAREHLGNVGLADRADHLPSQLSGGEKQRVCIARALVNEPAIILADEPTGNLDEENEKVVVELLQRLHGEGRTIALVTHNPEMGALAGRTIYLRHGRLDRQVIR
ncbi:putative ABC transport system ATP-binding protein [Paracoccus halophilus]|uniref:ABC transporter ATP-binding protein n=1 Tax=Paracoccus halophilus TaxID=376733 RepID=A0A099F8U1_9RHOB|nr:ABC transporter ATP-binding protein [Paracoccus halophilus]KGJ06656.1 ABC transporter ATP-binding protein [Paracoccus halophilus]SFA42399.1 putative ABC transport system ATP-binding protein [Paracoccus halophilus]